jgi:transcriptional regulator with XRE-family HTH domain
VAAWADGGGKRVTAPPASPWLAALRAEVVLRLRAQHSTQAALADRVGITPKHMSQVLTGKSTPRPEVLDRIAAAVGLRIAVVIGEAEPEGLPRGWGRTPKPGAEREEAAP